MKSSIVSGLPCQRRGIVRLEIVSTVLYFSQTVHLYLNLLTFPKNAGVLTNTLAYLFEHIAERLFIILLSINSHFSSSFNFSLLTPHFSSIDHLHRRLTKNFEVSGSRVLAKIVCLLSSTMDHNVLARQLTSF